MNKGLAWMCAAATLGGGLCIWSGTPRVRAAEGSPIASAALSATFAVQDTKYEYVGSSKCKMCHLSEHKSWKKTAMGRAFTTLKPGKAVEAKEKHGLDPNKDYTTDETCLACHTTGYGHPGGYAIPAADDKKAARAAKKLRDVGCEACHGPGSEYIKVFKDIFRTKRKYKVAELYAVGLTKIDAATCTTCHNENNPTYDPADPFDFEKAVDTETHDRKELKQRED